MRAAQPTLFPVRIIAGWLAAAALALAVSFALVTRDATQERRPGDAAPTIYSRSALGYAVLYHSLTRLGVPVAEGTAGSGPPANAAVVVIAEPKRDDRTLAYLRAVLHRAPAVLLVLPKREVRSDLDVPDRVAADRLLSPDDVRRVLKLVDEGASVERVVGAPLVVRRPLTGAPVVRTAQFVRSAAIEPWIQAGSGTVAGELRGPAGRVIVVADPDLLENHGIARGDNAVIALALVRSLREQRPGPVVFDEVVHGFAATPFGWLRLLFAFPFAIVTAQIAVAVALLMWAGSTRFGAPKPREPAFALGKQSLIANGARLLEQAGDVGFLAGRYADAVLRETARVVHAPRALSREELTGWFARGGRPAPAAAHTQNVHAVVAAAQALHAWRSNAIDES